MNAAIDFDKASIGPVEHRIRSGVVSSRVKVVAIATAKIARSIGARWLLDKDALVKQGFTSVELDYELKNVRMKHGIEKVAALELVSEVVNKFKVFRKGDDKKKAKRLMVSFIVHHTGSPFELLEHLMRVGEGEGICTLIPLQGDLFPEAPKEAKPKSKQLALPPATPEKGRKQLVEKARKVLREALSRPVAKKKAPVKKAAVKTAPTKPRPLTPGTLNEHGVFTSEKPVEQFKGAEKRFYAALFVVEVDLGYVAGYNVQAGHAGRSAMPSADGPYYGNYAEALAAAAAVVIEVASPVVNAGIRTHKREAEKMVTWAQGFGEAAKAVSKTTVGKTMAASTSLDPAGDGKLFEGLADASEKPKTGKDAAYPD